MSNSVYFEISLKSFFLDQHETYIIFWLYYYTENNFRISSYNAFHSDILNVTKDMWFMKNRRLMLNLKTN
jgi:hypothetical protein